jgi:hypothetical protein
MTNYGRWCAQAVVALLVCLLFLSCANTLVKGYKGPHLPPEKTAIVEPHTMANIVAYDGERPPGTLTKLILTPGSHTLEVSFSGVDDDWIHDSGPSHLFIEFTAEEGHAYLVRCESLSPARWTAYMTDKSTGKKIEVRYVLAPSWALPTFERAIREMPNDFVAWYKKSNALYDSKRYYEALQASDKVVELKPGFSDGWNSRGRIYLALNRVEDALEAFEKTIELNPKQHFSWYNKGLALQNLKRYEGALTAYDKAIELEPRDTDGWSRKAAVLMALGRTAEAADCLTKIKGLGVSPAPAALKEKLIGSWTGLDEAGEKGQISFLSDGRVVIALRDLRSDASTFDVMYEISGSANPLGLDLIMRSPDGEMATVRGLLEIKDDNTILVGFDTKSEKPFEKPRPASFSSLDKASTITLRKIRKVSPGRTE